jgi:ADP-ribose pyrophosphatase
MKKWKKLHSKIVLDVDWMRIRKDVVELPNGRTVNDFYVWEGKPLVMIVPVLKNGRLVLVRQYKHGVEKVTLEFPAGYAEETETDQETAERELIEETGYAAKTMTYLGTLTGEPNKSTGLIAVYCAQGLVGGMTTHFDLTEEIETVDYSVPELVEMVSSGSVWASYTISSLFLYLQKYYDHKKWV